MQFQRVVDLLEKADDAGAGGKQRELLEYAVRLVSREYIQSMTEGGNSSFDAAKVLTEMIEQEAAYNSTGR